MADLGSQLFMVCLSQAFLKTVTATAHGSFLSAQEYQPNGWFFGGLETAISSQLPTGGPGILHRGAWPLLRLRTLAFSFKVLGDGFERDWIFCPKKGGGGWWPFGLPSPQKRVSRFVS